MVSWSSGQTWRRSPGATDMRGYSMAYWRKSVWMLRASRSEVLKCSFRPEVTRLLWLPAPCWDTWPSTPGWRSQTARGRLSWTSCRSCSHCCKSFWGRGLYFRRAWAARPCCLKWWRWRRPWWGWWCKSCRPNSCCWAFWTGPEGLFSVGGGGEK